MTAFLQASWKYILRQQKADIDLKHLIIADTDKILVFSHALKRREEDMKVGIRFDNHTNH